MNIVYLLQAFVTALFTIYYLIFINIGFTSAKLITLWHTLSI